MEDVGLVIARDMGLREAIAVGSYYVEFKKNDRYALRQQYHSSITSIKDNIKTRSAEAQKFLHLANWMVFLTYVGPYCMAKKL